MSMPGAPLNMCLQPTGHSLRSWPSAEAER